MPNIEALYDGVAHTVDCVNVKIKNGGRVVILEVPKGSVWGLRDLIRHESYGMQITPESEGDATTEDVISLDARRTPIAGPMKILKKDQDGRRVAIKVRRFRPFPI
ncbi:hypothetical protein A3A79_05390 [Candidatus Gottesmanbacteria bacterium RIFCSPLOWO2_01_FULL_43_11b]|uniref:Uncharacterized protein n=1 Tax=Candidatus Gottesmanbacteria bacterium RIFCSPLOWO2_01_FULL_43_11b TaxID=1798392 RepID=A0A1F6AIS1_9BACT|nr:MAG: hypothetical protein A3A79_05390 [Candidatus Gottesmanbacteria bacterium RIFCSPLOWO2_01_FULL_43_11b]